jgi:hypothetical protein
VDRVAVDAPGTVALAASALDRVDDAQHDQVKPSNRRRK